MRPFIAAAALLLASFSAAQAVAVKERSSSVERVLAEMHKINQMEIHLGRLAEARGLSAEIRRYGALLERDHRLGDRRVIALARSERIPLTTAPPSGDEKKMARELERATGAAFDRAFLAGMKAGHAQAIALLDAARAKTSDPRLGRLIGKLLPILEQHRELASQVRG